MPLLGARWSWFPTAPSSDWEPATPPEHSSKSWPYGCAKDSRIRGIPTSQGSADMAIKLGIPLTTLEQVPAIDVDVDGADEVDPHGNLIKGYGGALVRERIVAAASRRFVVLVGSEKVVPKLGSHGKLPVEVVPFGLAPCLRTLAALGFEGQVRLKAGQRMLSDNGNHIDRLPYSLAGRSRRGRRGDSSHPRRGWHGAVPRHAADHHHSIPRPH